MHISRQKDILWITAGTFFIALGVENFLLPSKISCGGVSTIGTILFYVFNISLSVTNIFTNIILFALGFRFLGKAYVAKTIYGIVVFTIFLELCKWIPDYNEDVLSAVICGGLLLGLGLGVVVSAGGSTGGSDFAGVIAKKMFPHISVPVLIFIIDTIIILFSGIVFTSVTVIVYSLVAIFISLKISDFVMFFGTSARKIIINSEKSTEISDVIINKYGRGVTGIYSRGMYLNKDRLLIMTVVSPREVHRIIGLIKEIDSQAFVVVSDVKEVHGEGFKSEYT